MLEMIQERYSLEVIPVPEDLRMIRLPLGFVTLQLDNWRMLCGYVSSLSTISGLIERARYKRVSKFQDFCGGCVGASSATVIP